ncbi:AAA family ATPase [Aliarcobacter skirrowii]|uniref:AAA family ATPase n=1 Tax=Aliarcobacter skirrowii TaxID=28200 RepID=UPI00082453CF|nr:AAA family ATPase [Aliarcobacter skirrowii]
MNIIYIKSFGTDETIIDYIEDQESLVLKEDNWNDYGYYTFFHAFLWIKNKLYKLGGVRFLFEDSTNSHIVFNQLDSEDRGKYLVLDKIEFKKKFISLGASNEYYKRLKELLDARALENILVKIHDFPFLNKKYSDTLDLKLQETEGFNDSLTRDTDSSKAIKEASAIIFDDELDKDRFNFSFTFQLENFNDKHSVDFIFEDDFFPSNITTLIGKNGTGKSQTLKHLSECLQKVGVADIFSEEKLLYNTEEALSKKPQFSKVVIISYSPFETYYNKGASKSFSYCGLRDSNNNINKDIVVEDMKESFSKMLEDDLSSYEFEHSILKIDRLYKILKTAIPFFESIAIKIDKKLITNLKQLDYDKKIEIKDDFIIQKHFSKEFLSSCTVEDIHNFNISAKFINEIALLDKDNKKLYLSSGQEIFMYMIFSILGKIEKESLLIFDEPESYLHPNLEITFMTLLKEILATFNSYSIVATHSLLITRETPSKFVRVFDINRKKEPVIHEPSFETFGANLNTICNYVFNNALEKNKPFETWLKSKIDPQSDISEVLKSYKSKLNPETLMYIRNEILND